MERMKSTSKPASKPAAKPAAAKPERLDPRYSTASINPLTPRYLSVVAHERGYDTASLCRGLGFTAEDLNQPNFKISYRQGSMMIRRGQKLIGDTGLGLAVGSRQTLVSWGLVGFGMMTCATLGEASEMGIHYQKGAGSLIHIAMELRGQQVAILADPQFYDPDIEMFLIEEAFSSMVNIVRHLVGPQFTPSAIELVYQPPPHAAIYDTIFRCPVRFGCSRNRLITDVNWMNYPLPTYDPLVAKTAIKLIEENLTVEQEKVDLSTTIERAIRDNLKDLPSLQSIAATLNIGERTLRRRLNDAGFSYQGLLESVRKSRALELLSHSKFSVADVAAETGFKDVRNFRRAFKRWTGVAPTEIRE